MLDSIVGKGFRIWKIRHEVRRFIIVLHWHLMYHVAPNFHITLAALDG